MLHVDLMMHVTFSFHIQGGIVLSRVCAWYWLFTILSECVVSSEIGRRPKLRLTVAQHEKINKYSVLDETRWGRSNPPPPPPECVVSSEIGRRPKLRLTIAQHEKINKYTHVGRNKMGQIAPTPPPPPPQA